MILWFIPLSPDSKLVFRNFVAMRSARRRAEWGVERGPSARLIHSQNIRLNQEFTPPVTF
jgi:hypothetical protein